MLLLTNTSFTHTKFGVIFEDRDNLVLRVIGGL